MTDSVFGLMDEWGPEKIVVVSDRKTGMRGVLVLDNTARGTGKGGTRMSPGLTVAGSVTARPDHDLEMGRRRSFPWRRQGGHPGRSQRPQQGSDTPGLRRALSNEVPSEYVFGLDMGLAEEDAAIFLDELGDRGASTGLPRALGGLPYDQLGVTGYGVAEAAEAAAHSRNIDLKGSRVSIQGFGAVGQAAAVRLVALGATVVAVSTAAGAVHDPNGLDIGKLVNLRAETGDACVHHYGSAVPADYALTVDADILIPAAREDTVNDVIAASTNVKLVIEGANLPTSPSSRRILHERGIAVVPDFIANAGGIVAAAHSMAARYSPFVVEPEDIFTMISTKLRANTTAVLDESGRAGLTPHEAAYALAQKRVLEAMRLRRQIPKTATDTIDVLV